MAPASPVFAGESAPTEMGTPRLSIRPFSREDATDSFQHLTTSLTRYISPSGFVYPVATDNLPSRLIAEALGGSVTGTRTAANGSFRPPWRRAANGQKRSVTIFAKSTAQLPEDRSRLFVRYSTIAARAASLTAAPRSAAMGSRYPYRMLLHASESPNTPDAIPSASTKVIFAPLSARCYASEAPTMPALMTTTRLSRAFPISTFIL